MGMRRSLSLFLVALAAVILGVVAPASSAWACSCAPLTLDEHVKDANVILQGKVTDRADPGGGASDRLVSYRVEVTRVWKGNAGAVTEVRSPAEGPSCGLELETGREYVFFTQTTGNSLQSNLCSGTGPPSNDLVAGVAAATGSAGAPPHGSSQGATPPTSSSAWPAAGYGAVAILAALAAGWLLVRRAGRSRPSEP